MGALQLEGLEDAVDPFRGECPSCGTRVLAVEMQGREVVVEVTELLERFPCPQCAQVEAKGHERSECSRCGLSGWIGDPLPQSRDGRPVAVALDPRGWARAFFGARVEGEAIHPFHDCA